MSTVYIYLYSVVTDFFLFHMCSQKQVHKPGMHPRKKITFRIKDTFRKGNFGNGSV